MQSKGLGDDIKKITAATRLDQIAKKMRSKEVYGEADVDMLEDTYGTIEDKY